MTRFRYVSIGALVASALLGVLIGLRSGEAPRIATETVTTTRRTEQSLPAFRDSTSAPEDAADITPPDLSGRTTLAEKQELDWPRQPPTSFFTIYEERGLAAAYEKEFGPLLVRPAGLDPREWELICDTWCPTQERSAISAATYSRNEQVSHKLSRKKSFQLFAFEHFGQLETILGRSIGPFFAPDPEVLIATFQRGSLYRSATPSQRAKMGAFCEEFIHNYYRSWKDVGSVLFSYLLEKAEMRDHETSVSAVFVSYIYGGKLRIRVIRRTDDPVLDAILDEYTDTEAEVGHQILDCPD